MKILVLNGSPRKGNSVAAINAFVEGVGANHEIEVVDTYKLKVSPCMACGACQCTNGCVAKDDSNAITDKVVAADLVVFVSPVYWWGITAQMKMVIDKLYCRGAKLKGKKIGAIIVGGSPVEEEQYDLIRRQFACIAEYLQWDILFHKDYFATEKDDLVKSETAITEIKALGANL